MKNLAPHIYRQRLCIEGIYSIDVNKDVVEEYLRALSQRLEMTITFGPVIQNEAELVNPFHAGFEGVIMWAESGTHVYTWENGKFFSVDLYSCKPYDNQLTVEFTKEFFGASEIEFLSRNSQVVETQE